MDPPPPTKPPPTPGPTQAVPDSIVITRPEVLRVWRTICLIFFLHPSAGSFWYDPPPPLPLPTSPSSDPSFFLRARRYVVLNNLVKDEIAKGDLAKATAYWGAYEFTMKVTRLVLGSTFGVAVDKFGRKPALQLNSAAAICCVLTVYSVQTLWALVLGGAITGGLDIIDVSVQAIVYVHSSRANLDHYLTLHPFSSLRSLRSHRSDVGRAISHVGGWDGSDDK